MQPKNITEKGDTTVTNTGKLTQITTEDISQKDTIDTGDLTGDILGAIEDTIEDTSQRDTTDTEDLTEDHTEDTRRDTTSQRNTSKRADQKNVTNGRRFITEANIQKVRARSAIHLKNTTIIEAMVTFKKSTAKTKE